jgi:hypothetical protein
MMEMDEKVKSQWSGQFFAAGELTRRGYWVTFTLGNAPSTDLLVISPKGKKFRIEVKTVTEENYSWLIRKAKGSKDLWFILVVRYSPDKDGKFPNPKYWIVPSRHISKIIRYKIGEGIEAQVYKSEVSNFEETWWKLPA